MHHHIYHTEGFVLRGLPSGESSKYIHILTSDLGLVGVHVQNVRGYSSKLRYSLQDFSHSYISLVRGKNVWRLTNATLINNLYSELKDEKSKQLCANVFSLIRKLVAGEEKNSELFSIVYNALIFIVSNQISEELLSDLELILVLRILHNLGYADKKGDLAKFLDHGEWTEELVKEISPLRKEAILYVNNAIKATQL